MSGNGSGVAVMPTAAKDSNHYADAFHDIEVSGGLQIAFPKGDLFSTAAKPHIYAGIPLIAWKNGDTNGSEYRLSGDEAEREHPLAVTTPYLRTCREAKSKIMRCLSPHDFLAYLGNPYDVVVGLGFDTIVDKTCAKVADIELPDINGDLSDMEDEAAMQEELERRIAVYSDKVGLVPLLLTHCKSTGHFFVVDSDEWSQGIKALGDFADAARKGYVKGRVAIEAKYQNLHRRYLKKYGLDIPPENFRPSLDRSVESLLLGGEDYRDADGIVCLVQSGATLVNQTLKPVNLIFRSIPGVFTRKEIYEDPRKRDLIDRYVGILKHGFEKWKQEQPQSFDNSYDKFLAQVEVEMSDKIGALAAVTNELVRLGVDVKRSQSGTIEDGKTAKFYADVIIEGRDLQLIERQLGEIASISRVRVKRVPQGSVFGK